MYELSLLERNAVGQPTGRRLYIESAHASDLADFFHRHTPTRGKKKQKPENQTKPSKVYKNKKDKNKK